MRFRRFFYIVLLCVGASVAGMAVPAVPDRTARKFEDPAPPKLAELAAVAAPPARMHPRVRFHQKPKPLSPDAVTHDWTVFLGPCHNGVSTETHLLHEWPAGGPPLLWEMTKGTGYTSPAVQKDRLVYFHRMGDEAIIECLHPETGDAYWDFRYPTHFEDRFGYNNGPRASPVIDGDRVYVYGAEGRLFCLELQTGRVLWRRDLAADFNVPQDFFGTSTTPLVHGDLLIINLGAPGGPCVAAFHKQTGVLAWGAGERWGPSYASPVPATIHGRPSLLVFAGGESRPPSGGLLCLDPATGSIDFEFPWRSRLVESVNASSPVVIGDQVFISANYKTGSALVSVQEDFTAKAAWTNPDLGTHWNTAVAQDGYVYGFDGHFEDDASLLCLDLKTGKTMWRAAPQWEETVTISGQKRLVETGICRGALLRVDGKFLCLGEFGHLLWLDLTPGGYKELQRAWLFAARETWALPVLSRGLLYISQNTRGVIDRGPPRLMCYDLRGE